jgi:hypothetical protein
MANDPTDIGVRIFGRIEWIPSVKGRIRTVPLRPSENSFESAQEVSFTSTLTSEGPTTVSRWGHIYTKLVEPPCNKRHPRRRRVVGSHEEEPAQALPVGVANDDRDDGIKSGGGLTRGSGRAAARLRWRRTLLFRVCRQRPTSVISLSSAATTTDPDDTLRVFVRTDFDTKRSSFLSSVIAGQ